MKESDDKKLDSIADSLFLSFRFFRRMAEEGMDQGVRRFDPGRLVLAIVLRRGPLPTSEIASRMNISRPYMTVLVDKLIEEGLAERIPDKDDRRVINVAATEAGRESFKAFRSRARESVKTILSFLSSEEIGSLYDSMENIRNIISKLDHRGSKGLEETREG